MPHFNRKGSLLSVEAGREPVDWAEADILSRQEKCRGSEESGQGRCFPHGSDRVPEVGKTQ